MLDMLGAKYIVAIPPLLSKQDIARKYSSKLELIHEDRGWWHIYRNRNYLSEPGSFQKLMLSRIKNRALG